ncbi:MAG: CHAD domain-containing protein [Planctomycetes bacterium]|nr:CHAD domain-containing protein [Planctomycetota bacterium]
MLHLAQRLDELRAHAAIARVGADSRGVHRARATAGRIAAWLDLGGWSVLADDVRWLRRGLARARDLDVIVESAELAPDARAWFARERAAEQARVVVLLDDERFAALLAALAELPEPRGKHVRRALERMQRRSLRAGDALERAVEPLDAAHRLRRRLRRLRHALEWLELPAPVLRAAQTELGELHDRAALLGALERSPFERATRAGRDARANELEGRLASFRLRWPALRGELRRD